jgi:CRISPR/Cas system CMR subunit Cmr6 (Cas7 group RAMP superfamily)
MEHHEKTTTIKAELEQWLKQLVEQLKLCFKNLKDFLDSFQRKTEGPDWRTK